MADIRPVLGAKGASSYLTKYLVKALEHRDRLEELGFQRLWASSRNFPREQAIHLSPTTNGQGWEKKKRFVPVGHPMAKYAKIAAENDEKFVDYLRGGTVEQVLLRDKVKKEQLRRRLQNAFNRTPIQNS